MHGFTPQKYFRKLRPRHYHHKVETAPQCSSQCVSFLFSLVFPLHVRKHWRANSTLWSEARRLWIQTVHPGIYISRRCGTVKVLHRTRGQDNAVGSRTGTGKRQAFSPHLLPLIVPHHRKCTSISLEALPPHQFAAESVEHHKVGALAQMLLYDVLFLQK